MNIGFYIFIGLVVVAFVIYTIAGNKQHKSKLQTLAASRPKMSKAQYVEHFLAKDFEQEHIEEVYNQIASYISFDWFSLYPEDDLLKDYEIDEEDLDDMLASILKKVKMKWPNDDTFQELNKKYSNKVTAERLLEVIGNGG